MGANGFYSTRVCGAFLPFLPFSHKKQYTFKMGMAGDERISAYLEMKNGKNEKNAEKRKVIKCCPVRWVGNRAALYNLFFLRHPVNLYIQSEFYLKISD